MLPIREKRLLAYGLHATFRPTVAFTMGLVICGHIRNDLEKAAKNVTKMTLRPVRPACPRRNAAMPFTFIFLNPSMSRECATFP
jgi:hypothetical protein